MLKKKWLLFLLVGGSFAVLFLRARKSKETDFYVDCDYCVFSDICNRRRKNFGCEAGMWRTV